MRKMKCMRKEKQRNVGYGRDRTPGTHRPGFLVIWDTFTGLSASYRGQSIRPRLSGCFRLLFYLKQRRFQIFFLLVLLAVSSTQSSKTQQGLLRVQCENRVDLLWIRIVRTKQDSPACSPSKRTSECQEPYCSAIKKNKICSNMDGRRDYHTK